MTPKFFISLFLVTATCKSTCQNIVIANTKFNILYLGISNPIDFASKTLNKKDILLIPQRGEIHSDFGRYYYLNCNSHDTGILTIYAKNIRNNKIIDSVEFRLKKLPDPIIQIKVSNMSANVYKGTDILKDFYGVTCYYTGDFTDQNCRVIGFTLTITNSSSFQKDFYINSYKIPADIRTEIAELLTDSAALLIHDFKLNVGCIDEIRLVNNPIKLK